jgi:hypothetical protein
MELKGQVSSLRCITQLTQTVKTHSGQIKRIHFEKRLIKMDSYPADLSLVFIKKFTHFQGA